MSKTVLWVSVEQLHLLFIVIAAWSGNIPTQVKAQPFLGAELHPRTKFRELSKCVVGPRPRDVGVMLDHRHFLNRPQLISRLLLHQLLEVGVVGSRPWSLVLLVVLRSRFHGDWVGFLRRLGVYHDVTFRLVTPWAGSLTLQRMIPLVGSDSTSNCYVLPRWVM